MHKWLKRILKWTAITISALIVLVVGGVTIAYWLQDNDCEQRLATQPKSPMKALVHCDFGTPDVLQVAEIEKPVPADDEVLVKVRAAALNPYDWHFMKGIPYVMRLDAGLRRPKDIRVGVDFSGVVEAIGKDVTKFKPGDEVFGGRMGALAAYQTVSEKNLASKPENISFEEAGGVRIAALTALQAVRDHGKVRPGQKVLINGASGGVGTFAVQIAKYFDANVTGVSSGRNTELVRSLGADQTIDYTQEDYTQSGQQWDVIIDNVGSHSLLANRRALTPNGTYVMVGGPKGNWLAPMDRVLKMMLLSPF